CGERKGKRKTESNQEDGGKYMNDFKVFYDEEEDILYLAKEGEEAEVVEISPGVNMELDSNGKLIGVELFKASRMFKNVLKPMEKKLQFA
uniref:DUF2283 domain-containing protein n=1 Tax=Dissulfurispira sp. TaxID=2817609 RepID=UPI002FDA9FF8